jgi:hypothetical protein
MTIADFDPNARHGHLTTILKRVSGPVKSARNGATTLVGRIPATMTTARNGATTLIGRIPGTMTTARGGAQATTRELQKLPDSTLRSLAVTSAGVGAGLFLAGRRRFAVVSGIVPAFIGAAIVLRPSKKVAPAKVAP